LGAFITFAYSSFDYIFILFLVVLFIAVDDLLSSDVARQLYVIPCLFSLLHPSFVEIKSMGEIIPDFF
jgi:hypothetical protein